MTADVVALAHRLATEAAETNERRLLVLSGERASGYETLADVLDALSVPITATTLLGPDDRLRCEQLPQSRAGELLGTTREIVVVDAHRGLQPNALGAAVGAVDGGGLLVLLAPPLDSWPERPGAFAESLAVPPFSLSDVTGRFTRRLVTLLRTHRGIAIVDVDAGRILDDGLTDPAPRIEASSPAAPSPQPPGERRFLDATYERCRTDDQAAAVAAFESLLDDGERAVVLEADRGRGKSSAAGLAAGALARSGADVLVTAPAFRNAEELFARARELTEGTDEPVSETSHPADDDRQIHTRAGGQISYRSPTDAVDSCENVDVLIVDEAAALPVARLEALLAADRVAFATTIHGYEGAGRGFSVRFRDRLAESDHEVIERRLVEPIRYAAGDPVEVWAFRALCLDARPPVEPLVAAATPETVTYRALDPETLRSDERLLREAFGLLVLAHYRTEPNDLARLLDAPNLTARALVFDGHVVGVALLAREGGLSAETQATIYEGQRIPGNMIPDILTSQLRDESAGDPSGLRVVRIAVHHAARSRGLGSHLLERVRSEFERQIDWLGAGFGATPGLLAFWAENGYGAVHLSTTRNDTSGEHSAIVLLPTSDAGHELATGHAARFARRIPAVCSDTLAEVAPDVLRAALKSVDADAVPDPDLSAHEWRLVAGAAYGPGLFDVDPGPFRRLAVRYFVAQPSDLDLSGREERLLVRRVLQARDVESVADELGYHSVGQCMRALGDAFAPLVDRYGGEAAAAVRERFNGG
ncbi:GNAT family N-acetyltransferase [Halobacteria archaeon AArc-dxtr1]|nr:GNAT family N-acetyltransferase [Halobacteria archaeon AArc-dxtr1]